jgi:hypothetical protein
MSIDGIGFFVLTPKLRMRCPIESTPTLPIESRLTASLYAVSASVIFPATAKVDLCAELGGTQAGGDAKVRRIRRIAWPRPG